MGSETVLKVENLSKVYRLGEIGTGTISHDLNRWWARIRGKEDPFSTVGSVNDRTQSAKNGEYVKALSDINFEVKRGEVLGIIGKNGAGKSTLLKVISQITSPSTGSIKAKGRIASLLEVGTGMHPEMTGKENVYLNGTILGMTKKEINNKFEEIMEFAGCAKYADTPVKRYSSGMKVRLGFAVAAFLEPEILIVDEVLAVGDADFQKKAIGKMQEISSRGGRTVLFVSHNMGSVREICSKCMLIENGEIGKIGPTQEIINKYLYEDQESINLNNNIKQQIANLPIDPALKIIDVALIQNNNHGNIISSNKPLKIKVDYQVYEEVTGLRIYFDLLDKDNNIIIRSFNDERKGRISIAKPGKYIAMGTIPPNILVPKNYIIVVRATIFNVRPCTGSGIKIPITVYSDIRINSGYPNEPMMSNSF